MPTRRSFLKALGGAAATGALAAGGAGLFKPPKAGAAIPGAYEFTRLITSGDELGGGGLTLDFLAGPVTVCAAGKVVFMCRDSAGATGLWQIDLNDPGPATQVVRQGDGANGSSVSRIMTYDTDDQGRLGMLLRMDNGIQEVYLERGQGLERVATLDQEIGQTGLRYGGQFNDVVMHGDGDLLLVSHYTGGDEVGGRIGLFSLPGGENGPGSRLLMTTPSLVHGMSGHLGSLGLAHANHKGEYVVQAFVPTEGDYAVTASQGGTGGGQDVVTNQDNRGVLVTGNALRSTAGTILTLAWPNYPQPGGAPPDGEIIYGPRMDGQSQPAYVVHTTDSRMSLVIQDRVVISTGDAAPNGWSVQTVSPPNETNGIYFFTLHGFTDQNVWQLIAHNGSEARVILSMLDQVGDQRVINLVWGVHTEQVDAHGRLVLMAEWSDQATQSILLATPA